MQGQGPGECGMTDEGKDIGCSEVRGRTLVSEVVVAVSRLDSVLCI